MKNEFIKGIDGLRALAVLTVIIYHLNPLLIPGGFTGVDIFFVISGYVVAKSLAGRNEQPFRFFIFDFYKRRLIRIYPALLACLLITSFVIIIFLPRFFVSKSIDETAIAAFFGLSNFALAFNTDTYFSPSAEYNPFVHTWSLGVEEQYYLIFPVLFYLTVKNKAKYALESLFVLSFLLSVHHTFDNTNHAYYLLTSRFWELAAGAMLFKYHNSKVKETAVSKYYSYFGVVCIIISMAFSNKAMFPFPWAVFSVLGTCLLIHAIVITQRRPLEKNALIRLSETNIASHFGKLSYSLYLWHWPILFYSVGALGLNHL